MRRKKLAVKSAPLAVCFCLFTFVFCLGFSVREAQAFKILSPDEDSVLKAGASVPVKVDLGNDTGVVQVRYYWYGEPDETLVEKDELSSAGSIVAKPALVASASEEPPFGGAIVVPEDAVGTMRLLAVADISRGRLGGRSVFDEILVKVEPEAELTSIEFETEKPLRLGRAGQAATYGQVDSLGKIFELPVVGLFSDNVVRSIRHPGAGTSYRSSNETVIKVQPAGLLQVVGNGRATLTVSNRGKQADLDAIVEVNEEPNQAPIADAGVGRTVKGGTRVELNGIKSLDPEGEALFYSWSQVRGSKVPLLDLNMPKASFVAPQVSEQRAFRFKLRVTDKLGADSLPAFVDVLVIP